ncbi:MAG: two-component system response regulator CreB [Desulfobacteraceae bacterium]|nr:two-component system response regulator CreB [Desulfobacteraceae bacterium]
MKPNILIVEDESAIADTIQYALETEGFETCILSSGEQVMQTLSKGSFHLVILDVGLPDINGFELCKKIRKSHTLPIIFLTARSDEIDRVVGLEIGGDDYIIKPFSPRELSARVRAVLRRALPNILSAGETSCDPIPIQDGAFQIDKAKRRISYFGSVPDLSKYEYDLMQLFISHPGQVFARDHLMDKVWDEPGMSMDRTVDAHIKNIRAKLKQIKPDLDPIVTHRGLGYALKEDL